MSKKTNEFTLVATLADNDTLTGVASNNLDVQIAVNALKTKLFTITDTNDYFSTNNVEAALQQVGSTLAGLDARFQPLDPDLTAVAALTTTPYGRDLLKVTDAAALRTTLGAQPADQDLTDIAALSTTDYGRKLLTQLNAAAVVTYIQAQPRSGNLDTLAGTSLSSYGLQLLAMQDAAALRTNLGAAPLANPTFSGVVSVPGGTQPNDAVSFNQVQTYLNGKVDKATLTADGDLFTRAGGNITRITRAGLAADPAFTSVYATIGTAGPQGPAGPVGPMAPMVVKQTTPTAADYGQASIPTNAIWIVAA